MCLECDKWRDREYAAGRSAGNYLVDDGALLGQNPYGRSMIELLIPTGGDGWRFRPTAEVDWAHWDNYGQVVFKDV